MTEVDIILPRKNFNLQIKETFFDGITGIFGPSGSGKTSLLHAISGLEKPKHGQISINNRRLFDSQLNICEKTEKRNIGYVFQEGRLFPHMSVEKNITYGYKKNKTQNFSFEEVTELLNLKNILKSKPSQISGGERQRTALARTILSSPEILLLDEPFSAVDMNLRGQILPFINRIQKKFNIPILVVSHDLPDLLKLTDKLCIINDGICIGHDKYYKLLKNKEIIKIFNNSNAVNSISLIVDSISKEKGLTTLKKEKNGKEIIISCEKSNGSYPVGSEIKVFINADDIALSEVCLPNITIQNQIQGEITDIIDKGPTLFCIVNCGFHLIVEITSESKKRMKLEIGKKVWCLFKSAAIDVC